MSNLVNFSMSVLQGKKEIVIGSKVSQSEFDILQSICDREDRSMSYVLRELAIRGLAYYLQDGKLKTTDAEDARIAAGRNGKRSVGIEAMEITLSKPKQKAKTGT